MGDTAAEAVLAPAVLLQRASFLLSLETGILGGGGDVVPAGFEGVCVSGIGRQSWKWRDERCLGFVSGLEWMGEG